MRISGQKPFASLLVCALAAGCGTSYTPRSSGRISVVQTATGASALMKDGKRQMMGDPNELVAGNPAAEAQAAAYRRRLRLSLGFLGVGALTLIGGTAMLAGFHEHPGGTTVGIGLDVLGLAAVIASPVMALQAQARIYDAINLYNDGLDAASAATP